MTRGKGGLIRQSVSQLPSLNPLSYKYAYIGILYAGNKAA